MNERGWGSICGARRVRKSGAMGFVWRCGDNRRMQADANRLGDSAGIRGVSRWRRNREKIPEPRSTDYMIRLITALFSTRSLYMDRTVYSKILLK